MYRHFLVVFLLSSAQLSLAENADWDCEKNEAGEWSCSSDSTPVSKKTMASPRKTTRSKIPVQAFETPVSDIKVAVEESVVPLAVNETQNVEPEFPEPIAIAPAPPQNVASKLEDGWSCAPNAEEGTWDCALVGANPEGEMRIVAETEQDEWFLFNRTFNSQQERVFNNLLRDFPQNPWGQCDSRRPLKIDLSHHKKAFREQMPLDIYSDYSEIFDKEVANFVGNVEMTRADQHLTADRANFNTASNMLDTQGNVYYSEQGLSLFSDSATLRFAENSSVLRDVLFIAGDAPIRGSAKVAYWDSKELSHYKEAAYTSCRPGNQDWVIHADRLKMNKDSGLGSATNAWLEFKGIPVLYTPYINFPIDNRRASGFLAPSWGTTDENGFDVEMPFYWNIAPDYDMILTPRYLGKRGGILGVDFRHLSAISESSVGIEYMPEDYIREGARFHGILKNKTVITPELMLDVDLNYVSDDDYFDELGNALSVSDTRHLKSRADLTYQTDNVDFLTRFENYQTIDRTIASADLPYQKLPQIQLNLSHSFNDMPIDLGMENEFVYFYRSSRVSGQRINLKPSIAFPYNTASAFITPKLAMQYTQYFLENRTQGSKDSLSRVLPIASVDSGLFFERELQFADSSLLHTIEPRAYYLYIPYSNQDALPVFDSSLNDFTFNSLFRENRFSGSDRIQDTNQFTVALTTRLIDANSGVEHLKLAIGEVFYLKNRRVTLPNDPIETRSLSNLVGELSGRLNENWSFSTGAQWDPDINDVTRGFANLHYANKAEQIANIGYRYRKGELVQSDISFRWPIYDNWYAVGRWQYSLKFNTTKESFMGVEKESCCWRFRIIGRRYVNSISDTSEAETQTGVFVQLELKGLTSIGDNVEEFLEKNISGYEKPL